VELHKTSLENFILFKLVRPSFLETDILFLGFMQKGASALYRYIPPKKGSIKSTHVE
jgi:hypothetical protein